MDSIVVTGNGPLSGQIPIAGAKNACLTLMPATLLSDEPLTLTNAPRLSDIKTMTALLGSLGAEVQQLQGGQVLVMSSHNLDNHVADYDIVRKMRASNLVLGPMLARLGHAVVSLPGGCAIGARPMDLHIQGLEALGAEIELRDGYLHAKASKGLKGAKIKFNFASVGATENVLMAATLAKGTTVLENAAREPEIVDLATCLRRMGAQIDGDGTSTITIQGVDRLGGATHPVVTDRIELGTYMLAPAMCGGEVECLGGRIDLVGAFCEKLDEAGISVTETDAGLKVARKNGAVRAVNVTTEPFPGFPTDLQAQMMALMCTAEGTSVLEEKIFENRFMHAPELTRMGARIEVHGGTATVTGVERLKGAPVMATDLRASVSLILAGLAAEGETVVSRVYHLDRGYEHVVRKFEGVGAKIGTGVRQMSDDATFEDGREAPLNLGALDGDDLEVISSLVQDAVFPITEMKWTGAKRRFAVLLNRFRWEDNGRDRHGPERVRSLLVVDNVLKVASQGIDRSDTDLILSVLSVTFEAGDDGGGHVHLTLAGDGAIRLSVEALDVTLKDVTRPYAAPSKSTPDHGA